MRTLSVTLLAAMMAAPAPAAQKPIEAKDGDVIVMDGGARVRLVRRSHGTVRAVASKAQRWVVLLLDSAPPSGGAPDGRVDVALNIQEISGDWPLGDRWEGAASIDEYVATDGFGSAGLALVTPSGSVQLLNRRDGAAFRDLAPGSAALTFVVSGRSADINAPFDQAEAQQVALAERSAAARSPRAGGPLLGAGSSAMRPSPSGTYPAPQAPVRVGGNIRTPAKIEDAAAVTPPGARDAGLGVPIILEIIIAADGRVRDAKVLRSVPPLDQAAIDTVKQWRYEPTLLNGAPVEVIMTVTVTFR